MRNWNLYFFVKSFFSFSLRAYLWGIETRFQPLDKPYTLKLRAYLWGIETIWRHGVFFLCLVVESLPMRNWNYFFLSSPWNPNKVESLPMRNWNSYMSPLLALYPKNSWEPTYEELKLLNSFSLGSKVHRWEPTYEELKLITNNWNTNTRIALRAYLWGIETILGN